MNGQDIIKSFADINNQEIIIGFLYREIKSNILKETPNCELCKWKKYKTNYLGSDRCLAQGQSMLELVCNSEECQNLYEKRIL